MIMYCSGCGKQLPNGSTFCSGCGKQLLNSNISQNAGPQMSSNKGLKNAANGCVYSIDGLLFGCNPKGRNIINQLIVIISCNSHLLYNQISTHIFLINRCCLKV